MSKAGFSVFTISTRNSSAAVANMLQGTGAEHLFVSPDTSMQAVAADALGTLAKSGITIAQHAMPVFEDLYPAEPDPCSPFEGVMDLPGNTGGTLELILHSSGKWKFRCPRCENYQANYVRRIHRAP